MVQQLQCNPVFEVICSEMAEVPPLPCRCRCCLEGFCHHVSLLLLICALQAAAGRSATTAGPTTRR